MNRIKGRSQPVEVWDAKGKSVIHPNLGSASKANDCARVTIKRAADKGTTLPNGSRAKWVETAEAPPEPVKTGGRRKKAESKAAAETDRYGKKAEEIQEDPDAPYMEPEQLRWVAGQMRLHAEDLLVHAAAMDVQAKLIEEKE